MRRIRAGKFTVDVIENFKAPLPAELILESYRTSCDIGLRPGQEWIIFAKMYKGYATVYACDYSTQQESQPVISFATGLRYRQSSEELLNSVRQLTGRPIKVVNGKIEKFYANGRRALLTIYKQGGREEERTVWHENGRLWGKEFYRNGVKHGLAAWWNANGTPGSTETFADGIAVDTSRYWYNTDVDSAFVLNDRTLTEQVRDSTLRFHSMSHLQRVRVSDRQGRLRLGQEFDWYGRLRDETIGMPEMGMEWRTAYDPQGKINFLIVLRTHGLAYQREDTALYRIEYQPDGSRQVIYYDEKGRMTRWSKFIDNKETVLEEKRYSD